LHAELITKPKNVPREASNIHSRIDENNGLDAYHNSFLQVRPHITRVPMARVQKRKYEKIDDAEIDLVTQCNDSHEFYERYRETFPTRKKGIDSISKIWKRRSEFMKKQQGTTLEAEQGSPSNHELELLVSAQNKILAELSGTMKEQLKVSKEILARFPKQIQKYEELPLNLQKHVETKVPEHKEPVKKSSPEKPADIMIGS
jgi:hypothetical protein